MMAEKVYLSTSLLQTITQAQWSGGVGVRGFLVGEVHGSSPRRATAVWQADIKDVTDMREDIDACLAHFPGGQTVVGLVVVPKTARSIKSIVDKDQGGIDCEFEEILGSFESVLEQFGLTRMLGLCLWKDTPPSDSLSSALFILSEDGVEQADICSDVKVRSTIRMRLTSDIPLVISTESDTEDQLNAALEQEAEKLLQNQASSFAFGFLDNSVLLHRSGLVVGASTEGWTTCRDVYKHWTEEQGGGVTKKKGGAVIFQAPVPVSVVQLATTGPSPNQQQYAPIIRHRTGTFKTTSLILPLDVLVEVEEKTPLTDLAGKLFSAVIVQIGAHFECLKAFTHKRELYTPEVFHFQVPLLDTPVSVIYPLGVADKDLAVQRKKLHTQLCLPLDRPLLRRGCAGHFLTQTAPAGYLLNTHVGLADPPVKSATTCLVQGYYSYHHYMQDRFNDDKWGCAYRSLQTICSWFNYQGFTDKGVPTHREIQQALFDIGDKEQKFVGSRQWIGSFEVSFVLDHLLGVTSKFINVNSGGELSTVGQQLMEHFHSQGTPVMIGGGVLAHTILGVAYSELTGDISFLILDPHYTGGEDLKVIQDKGWCGWKDMSFWNQTAHYNLCLPQRPSTAV